MVGIDLLGLSNDEVRTCEWTIDLNCKCEKVDWLHVQLFTGVATVKNNVDIHVFKTFK